MDNRYAKQVLEQKHKTISDQIKTLTNLRMDHEREVRDITHELENLKKSLEGLNTAINLLK